MIRKYVNKAKPLQAYLSTISNKFSKYGPAEDLNKGWLNYSENKPLLFIGSWTNNHSSENG